jgi:hypothetical protein
MTSVGPNYLRLSAAARLVPHDGRPPSPATMVRWVLVGRKLGTPGGGRVRLRAVKSHRGWLTTEQWIEEFVAALSSGRAATGRIPQVEERARAAIDRLAARGF